MSKTIVFCADGTWDGLGDGDAQDLQADATNVLRLFAALAGTVTPDSIRKQDEQEKVLSAADGTVLQVAKYLHGVGDSQNKIRKVLGGVFGEGFIGRIVRGYTFVSRNYRAGDRILLNGFSRGAYTARALGGMIATMGLLPADAALAADGSYDAEAAYKQGVYVWAQYRRAAGKASSLLGFVEEFLGTKVDIATLVPSIPIAAIGVWDTVGSLGIPLYGLDKMSIEKIDLFQFADTVLSRQVAAGLQALALDEQRVDFQPTLWADRNGIQQRWFCGAHGDVGGGYPKQDLSMCTLDWMIGHLKESGAVMAPAWQASVAFDFGPIHTPYQQPPFNALAHAPRKLPADALFHPSVPAYLKQFPDYTPAALTGVIVGRQLDPKTVMA